MATSKLEDRSLRITEPVAHKVECMIRFVSKASDFHKRRRQAAASSAETGIYFNEFWVGLAIGQTSDGQSSIGISLNDGTYTIDFAIYPIWPTESKELATNNNSASTIIKLILKELLKIQEDNLGKILGAGITYELDLLVPDLCSCLWSKLDLVPMVFKPRNKLINVKPVDEIADSMARKCLMHFGPIKLPQLMISIQNEVQVDIAGLVKIATLDDYRHTVRGPTWRALVKIASTVRDRKLRIAFFSATPQGGGVALMRHALLRLLRLLGIHGQWFVPKPRPEIFRITKTNHNILQGAVGSDVRSTDDQLESINRWVTENATRYWVKAGGPLSSPEEGGAHLVVIDDPQMPGLIPIAKQNAPHRTVIYRSHIEIRDDLIGEQGSAAEHIWSWLWPNISEADIFLSHPVKSFVPSVVKKESLGWMPATTDWLDGLNKDLNPQDTQYYLELIQQQCRKTGQPPLSYPSRPYITQIARFDPSKGIPDTIESYAKFRHRVSGEKHKIQIPQLVLCGHSSVDDPDGTLIFDQTMNQIHQKHHDLRHDIIVLRLSPVDQLLNTIISGATIVLQLSTREGFEVKVSEALHKGKPVIATKTGGIPLQIADRKNGYLVQRGDSEAVSRHMYDLFTNQDLYEEMSKYALQNVSDEVGTVGNALNWLYLASAAAEGKLEPGGHWINDLAREATEEPYEAGEPKLPRDPEL